MLTSVYKVGGWGEKRPKNAYVILEWSYSKIEEFFIIALATQMTQKVKMLFSNVSYRPTVYKTGAGSTKGTL